VHKRPYAEKMLLCLYGKSICYPGEWFWPPFSPDLNLLHFSIWSVLETRELAATQKNFAALPASFSKVWAPLVAELARNASRRRRFHCIELWQHHKHKLPSLFKAAKPSA
jgi:hypothetical protein